jgi:hypothetical protein
MVAVVSTERLDLIRSGCRLPDGRRQYLIPQIGRDQFHAIRRGVALALGLDSPFAVARMRSDSPEVAPAEILG